MLKAKFDLLVGDRLCPADVWRVSLYLDGEELMFREWATDVNGNDINGAEKNAKAFYNKLKASLLQPASSNQRVV